LLLLLLLLLHLHLSLATLLQGSLPLAGEWGFLGRRRRELGLWLSFLIFPIQALVVGWVVDVIRFKGGKEEMRK